MGVTLNSGIPSFFFFMKEGVSEFHSLGFPAHRFACNLSQMAVLHQGLLQAISILKLSGSTTYGLKLCGLLNSRTMCNE